MPVYGDRGAVGEEYVLEDGGCFGCGEDNPIGLRLHFDTVEDGVHAVFTPERHHQGYAGVVHGGLVATMLDEALAWAVLKKYGRAVTAEFYMRHRHPVPVDQPLYITGRVLRRRLGLVEVEGEIADAAGTTLAQGRGKFMLVKQASGML